MSKSLSGAVGSVRVSSSARSTARGTGRRTARRAIRASHLLAAAAFVAAVPAFAQTSGTWVSPASGNWFTATNWSANVVPNNGGTASFVTLPRQTGNVAVTTDGDINVSQITFDSAFAYIISEGSPLTLSGPAVVNVARSARDSATNFRAGHALLANLIGENGLTKTGPGTLTLGTFNAYNGPTTVSGGALSITAGDNALGQSNPGSNDITLSGSTLRVSSAALLTARPLTLSAAGGTVQTFASATFTSSVTGPGSLTKTVGTANLILQASNSYAGFTRVTAGQLVLSNNGSILNSSAYLASSAFTLDNAAVNNNNRLSDTAPFTSSGGQLAVGGNASAATTEQIGTLTLASGTTVVTLLPNAAQSLTLGSAGLVRQNRAGLSVRGTSLGAAAGPNIANFRLDSTPVGLLGAGGPAGSTRQSILPWAVGSPTVTSNGSFALGAFLTFDPATQTLRPLAPTEHLTSVVGTTADDNVRITTGGTTNLPTGGLAVNSLTVANAGGPATSNIFNAAFASDVLTVTSGGIIHHPANVLNSTTLNVAVDFGTSEGVIYSFTSGASLNFGRPISGSGGLTKLGSGGVVFQAGAVSTYTGVTTISEGTLQITGDVLPNVPGPLGNSETAIVLSPGFGNTASRLFAATSLRIDRNVTVVGDGTQPANLGTVNAANIQLTVNGNIDMQRQFSVELGAATGTATFNGTLSGPGLLSSQGSTSGQIVLNASNTFSGGTELGPAKLLLGHDNALGSGPVLLTGATSQIAASAPRTVANDLVFAGISTGANTVLTSFTGTQLLTFTGTVDFNGGNPTTGGGKWNLNVTNTALTTFAGPVVNGGFNKGGAGTLALTGSVTSAAIDVSLGTVLTRALRDKPIAIGATAVLRIAPGSAVSSASSLLLVPASGSAAYATLDITDNSLVVRSGDVPALRAAVAAWLATPNLSGAGLKSSLAIPSTAPNTNYTTVAVFPNTTGTANVAYYDSFGAIDGLTASDVIVRYTYLGDTDLDGALTARDLTRIIEGLTTGLTGWQNGDINYDGAVTTADLALFNAAFAANLPSLGTPTGTTVSAGAVPEPAAALPLLAASLLLTRRRR